MTHDGVIEWFASEEKPVRNELIKCNQNLMSFSSHTNTKSDHSLFLFIFMRIHNNNSAYSTNKSSTVISRERTQDYLLLYGGKHFIDSFIGN